MPSMPARTIAGPSRARRWTRCAIAWDFDSTSAAPAERGMSRAIPTLSLAAEFAAALPARRRHQRGSFPVIDGLLPSTDCANQGVAMASPTAALPDPASDAPGDLLAGDSPRGDAARRESLQSVRMLRRATRGQCDALRRMRAET